MSIIQGTSKAAGGGYTIDQSILFNADDSAYLTRTPGSAGNRKTWTYSIWFKYAGIGTQQMLGGAGTSGNETYIQFLSTGELQLRQTNSSTIIMSLQTSQVFRDPSAWYHIVIAVDTTQATSSDRIKIYINGSQITAFSTASYYSLNYDSHVNNNVAHYFGRRPSSGSLYFDGYMAEINFIDGTALAPTSFGKVNSTTGQWVPIKYTGSATGNSYYITGEDSADLGADYSGNGNDFTSSGLTSADQMLDTPTDNQSTYNPIAGATLSSPAYSEGNTRVVNSSETGADNYRGTIGVSSGKWYVEFLITDVGAGENAAVGVVDSETPIQNPLGAGNSPIGFSADSYAILPDGRKINNNSASAYGSSYTNGDVMGIALDMDNGAIWFSKNDTWQASATQSEIEAGTTTNAAFTGLTGTKHFASAFSAGVARSADVTMRPEEDWTGTCPSGFKALCTANLDDPTIALPTDYFQTVLDTGANIKTTAEALYTDQFEWIKDRDNTNNHQLIDSVRGTSAVLQSNTTSAETTYSAPSGNSVGWVWKANGTGSSNTDGSITSTVSANPAGFGILTYTGTGVAATIGHGLGITPKMVIVKERSPGGDDWYVYHEGLPSASYALTLNTTAVQSGPSAAYWNSTAPTSSVFSLGTSLGVNQNTATYVAYCFAEVEGFSKFGSYIGTNGGNPFIYTGFQPAFLLVKSTSSGRSWVLADNMRGAPYNPVSEYLIANTTAATGTTNSFDLLSNGFRVISGVNQFFDIDASGQTFIYAAFAEAPFQYARAR